MMLMLDYCVKEKSYDINEIFENILYVQLLFICAVIASKMFPKKVGPFFFYPSTAHLPLSFILRLKIQNISSRFLLQLRKIELAVINRTDEVFFRLFREKL